MLYWSQPNFPAGVASLTETEWFVFCLCTQHIYLALYSSHFRILYSWSFILLEWRTKFESNTENKFPLVWSNHLAIPLLKCPWVFKNANHFHNWRVFFPILVLQNNCAAFYKFHFAYFLSGVNEEIEIIVKTLFSWIFVCENNRDHLGNQIADHVVPMGYQIFDFSSKAASPHMNQHKWRTVTHSS